MCWRYSVLVDVNGKSSKGRVAAVLEGVSAVKIRLLLTAGALISVCPATSQAQNGYTFEEQQACTGDAFRLCASVIPDIPRITSCLQAKRDQLTPACSGMFEPGRERHLERRGPVVPDDEDD
jgi:hypothetical protein